MSGIDGILPYLDDIFIQGKNVGDHNLKVKQILECLQISGIHLKLENAFPEIELLEFRVHLKGISQVMIR